MEINDYHSARCVESQITVPGIMDAPMTAKTGAGLLLAVTFSQTSLVLDDVPKLRSTGEVGKMKRLTTRAEASVVLATQRVSCCLCSQSCMLALETLKEKEPTQSQVFV